MQKKNFQYLFPIFIFLALSLWFGCSDEPSSVGIGLLSSQDLVRLDTITITGATGSPVRKHINTGLSSNLLVGKYLGYEARALLNFSSIPDTLKTVSVLSASLILKPSYRLSEPENVLSFSVHKMSQGWTETGITWDSLNANSYEPTARGTFTGVVADSDSVTVPLDTNLVRSWFQTVGTEPIFGILLIPKTPPNTILGFHSFQSTKPPRLLVTYSKDGAQSTLVLSSGRDAYVADNEDLATNPNLLYVQAGVAYRTVLKFDLSGISVHTGIHRATLELTLSRSTSRLNSLSVDSLISFSLLSSDSVDNTSAVLGRRLDPDSDVYTFTVTSSLQRWVNGRVNHGLQIEAFAEVSTLDLFTFFAPSAGASVQPRLKVFYSRLL